MPDRKSVVWILGAGFSRPLGAPLLTDLFTFGSTELIRAAYGPQLGSEARTVSQMFLAALDPGPSGSPGSEHYWRNAEEFLETLDEAASGNGSARARLLRAGQIAGGGQVTEPDHGSLRETALRVLAAECSEFLKNADAKADERWIPYLGWAEEKLDPEDTVITFNYDLVPDVLAARSRTLFVLSPENDPRDGKMAQVLKLALPALVWVKAARPAA